MRGTFEGNPPRWGVGGLRSRLWASQPIPDFLIGRSRTANSAEPEGTPPVVSGTAGPYLLSEGTSLLFLWRVTISQTNSRLDSDGRVSVLHRIGGQSFSVTVNPTIPTNLVVIPGSNVRGSDFLGRNVSGRCIPAIPTGLVGKVGGILRNSGHPDRNGREGGSREARPMPLFPIFCDRGARPPAWREHARAADSPFSNILRPVARLFEGIADLLMKEFSVLCRAANLLFDRTEKMARKRSSSPLMWFGQWQS